MPRCAGRPVGLTLGLLAGLLFVAAPASSQPAPVYKDAERFAAPGSEPYSVYEERSLGGPAHPLRPARRRLGDPSYSGSEYGLGKPSYNGLGSRPDWGRSGL